MKIKDWCEQNGYGPSRLATQITLMYGDAPSKQHLSKVIGEEKPPSLEIALMLRAVTKGQVRLEEMLIKPKFFKPEVEVEVDVDSFLNRLTD